MKKFTFKIIKPTGKWKSFESDIILIKLNKKECGYIEPDEPHKVRLMVVKNNINEDGNPNCIWKWITFKSEFKTIEDAKSFLNENFITITSKFNIFLSED